MSTLRRYGGWAGNPKGCQEDTTLCIESVYPTGRGAIPHQCGRKRGFGSTGEYCNQHSPEVVKAKADKAAAAYEARSETWRNKFNDELVGRWIREHEHGLYELTLKNVKGGQSA